MRPSQLFDYALRALVDLALHESAGPVKVAAIAKRQSIPVRCLEQVCNRLRRQGLVMAERGPRGGYRLSQPASQIPVSAVFQSFELPRKTVSPTRSSIDPTRSLWQQVEKAVQTTLQATTLETLAAQAREQNPALNHRFTFHI